MNKGQCKHFTGVQNGTCGAGVRYELFRTPNRAFFQTLPCLHPGVSTCEKREYPSAAELAEYERDCEKDVVIIVAIDKLVSDGQKEGKVACPCGGTITFRYPASHALRAKCDTCSWRAMS